MELRETETQLVRGDMKVRDCHERWVAAAPDRITALIADFDLVWPAQLAPTPREVGPGRYDAGLMIWQEVERPGAARAFRVASPEEIRGEHWFELVPDGSGTVVRHTIEATAAGRYEAVWAERIGPKHGVIMEALLDKVQALVR
jgi:hypothetical protein